MKLALRHCCNVRSAGDPHARGRWRMIVPEHSGEHESGIPPSGLLDVKEKHAARHASGPDTFPV